MVHIQKPSPGLQTFKRYTRCFPTESIVSSTAIPSLVFKCFVFTYMTSVSAFFNLHFSGFSPWLPCWFFRTFYLFVFLLYVLYLYAWIFSKLIKRFSSFALWIPSPIHYRILCLLRIQQIPLSYKPWWNIKMSNLLLIKNNSRPTRSISRCYKTLTYFMLSATHHHPEPSQFTWRSQISGSADRCKCF